MAPTHGDFTGFIREPVVFWPGGRARHPRADRTRFAGGRPFAPSGGCRPARRAHRPADEEAAGEGLFKFLADDGAAVDVKRDHLNDYIKSVMGPDFTAKDFRTWAGTLICACALARVVEDEPRVLEAAPKNEVRKKVVEAVKETAAELGNTPAVCRSSYIEPSILSSFEKGEVVEKYFEKVEELVDHTEPTLAEPEKALKSCSRRVPSPSRPRVLWSL